MGWDTLTLYYTPEADSIILWSMQGPFSNALMAGLFLACHCLLNHYAYISEDYSDYSISARDHETGQSYVITSLDEIDFELCNIVTQASELQPHLVPAPGCLGIWVWLRTEGLKRVDQWVLVQSSAMDEFMRGFISICVAFGVDFRHYLRCLPIDANRVQYDLPAYRLKQYFSP